MLRKYKAQLLYIIALRVLRAQLIISYSLSCDYTFDSRRVYKKRFIYYIRISLEIIFKLFLLHVAQIWS